jgi:hypothetical protein
MMLIPVVLLACDSFLVLSAIQLNDRTCKEAARIASNGDPRKAPDRAEEVLAWDMPNPGGPYAIRLVQASTNVKRSQVEDLFPYGGQVNGVVDVTTEVSVRPFCLSWILGKTKSLYFQSKEELPVTYVVPNQAEAPPPNPDLFSKACSL